MKRAIAASTNRFRSAARGGLFGPVSTAEGRRLAGALREETVGGAFLLFAAAIALLWANSPWWAAYNGIRDAVVGPAAVHLDLSLGTWAADGLLAVFFFIAGLEVKREFVAGDLRDRRRAALPVAAAVGGVVLPLTLYLVVNTMPGGDRAGWAVPIATDIAFALAVLAVTGSHLPTALRTFLLTLAVVDDLIAITVIAVFFTDDLTLTPLVLAVIPLAAFGFLARREWVSGWWLLPLACTVWALVHASGIHATVAGILLGFAVPVAARGGADATDVEVQGESVADRWEHRVRPWSAGVAVPVFAFFAAGVRVEGLDGIRSAAADPVVLGVVAGLLVGKPVGVWVAAWLTARLTRAELDDDLRWVDIAGLALPSGIGFTVSLLIGELAFAPGTMREDHVKIAVLAGSLLAAGLATVVLRLRNRRYRRRAASAAQPAAAQPAAAQPAAAQPAAAPSLGRAPVAGEGRTAGEVGAPLPCSSAQR